MILIYSVRLSRETSKPSDFLHPSIRLPSFFQPKKARPFDAFALNADETKSNCLGGVPQKSPALPFDDMFLANKTRSILYIVYV